MDLLKEVANDRLVIMVTHNPELAEEYATRIVKLKDGQITDDSDPYIVPEQELSEPEHKNLGKASMSIGTALSLSFNNLLTKKGRTILTAFAGSIGIIGIALILSLSTGFQNYIDKIQEDTLTSYPLTITSETADTASMLLSMASETGEATGENTVRERQYLATMFSKIGTNDLKSFKKYLEKNSDKMDEMISLIDYKYSVTPMIYNLNSEKKMAQVNPSSILSSMTGSSSTMAMMSGMSTAIFNEMLDAPETIAKEYDILAGRMPEKYDELLLVLPEPNGMSDMLVYGMGLRDEKEFLDMISKLMAGEKVENKNKPLEYTYDELLKLEYRLINPTDTYQYNETYNIYESMVNDEVFMKKVYEDAVQLKIVGIVCAKDGATSGSLGQGIVYTKALTKYIIDEASKSEMVKKQLADKEVNVLTGKRFDDESQESGIDFQDMISVDTEKLSAAFGGNISEKDIADLTQSYITQISASITTDTTKAKKAFSDTLLTLANGMLNDYISRHKDPVMGMAAMKVSEIENVVNAYMGSTEAANALAALEKEYVIPQATFKTTYTELLKGLLQACYAVAPYPNAQEPTMMLNDMIAQGLVTNFVTQDMIVSTVEQMGAAMTQAVMQKSILSKVGELSGALVGKIAGSFQVDQAKIAEAFQFNMSEQEISRLMKAMSSSGVEKNAETNLISFGYQDLEKPSNISFYFEDFDSKEQFIDFLDKYNKKMEKENDEKVIKYADITGMLMSSVKTIVDSVSYVLIAFVSISLVVSSIMIGIITYISVLERTKEIGVLRAIGASKKNISSIFNAETFIVGLFAGLLGIGVTLLMLLPINMILHSINKDITAMLPIQGAIILVVLSVILTLIGGLIPSKQAAKKDPVLALRSE